MKNNFLKYLFRFLIVLSAIIYYVSCNDEENTAVETGSINITYNWQKQPKSANTRTLIYKQGKLLLDTITAADGIMYSLYSGEYQLISFNNNPQKIGFQNLDNYDTAEAFIKTQLRSTESIIEQPDPFYGFISNKLDITKNKKLDKELTIHNFSKSIQFIIQVDNINIQSCTASLSGISQVFFFSSGKGSEINTGTITFDLEKSNSVNYTSSIKSFGSGANLNSSNNSVKNILKIFFTMNNGNIIENNIDITDILKNLTESGMIITLSVTFGADTKFNVVVKEWQNGHGAGNAN